MRIDTLPSVTGAASRPVRETVITALATIADCDASLIADDTELASLGLDSLDITTVLLLVEEAIGTYLPLEVLAEAAEATERMVVADLVRLLSTANASN